MYWRIQMNSHTTVQQQTTDSDINNPRKKAYQLTADDMLKMGELRFLSIHQVAGKLDICKSTIYDWLSEKSPRFDPSFPRPIKINGKSIVWIFNEIEDWMLSKIALTRGKANEQISTLSTQ